MDVKSGEDVAIKLEPLKVKHPQLLYEAKLLEKAEGRGFPKVYWRGTDDEYNILVMERLGASLEELLALCGGRMSFRTVLQLSQQLLQRIQLLHSLGFVHRDIKAENFLIGWKSNRRVLYAIDLGLARPWRAESGAHVPYKDGKKLVGTARFSSVTSHLGVAQSRRDDMEALGYLPRHGDGRGEIRADSRCQDVDHAGGALQRGAGAVCVLPEVCPQPGLCGRTGLCEAAWAFSKRTAPAEGGEGVEHPRPCLRMGDGSGACLASWRKKQAGFRQLFRQERR